MAGDVPPMVPNLLPTPTSDRIFKISQHLAKLQAVVQ